MLGPFSMHVIVTIYASLLLNILAPAATKVFFNELKNVLATNNYCIAGILTPKKMTSNEPPTIT